MKIVVTGKKLDIGEALRSHIEDSLGRLIGKYFGDAIETDVVISREGRSFRVDISVHIGRSIYVRSHDIIDDPYTAFDMAAAWSFVDEDALHLHGDYLVHNYGVFRVSKGYMPFYYGIGARLKTQNNDSRVGIRFPVGVNYLFARDPIDIFFELVPILDVTPSTEFSLNASLGARYFFR